MYRSLFESMSEGFHIGELIYDGNGRPADFIILGINAAYESQSGLRRDQVMGRRMTEVVPSIEPVWFERYDKVVRTGRAHQFEDYNPAIGRWLKVYAYSLRKGNRFAAIFIDITKRKQAEELLQRSETFLNNVFDSIRDSIGVLDRDLNIVRTNHVAEEWYSHNMPLKGKKCYEAYHGRASPCDVCPSTRAIERKATQCEVVPFQGKNGAMKGWLSIYAFPLIGDDGNVIGVIEHVRDITQHKRNEDALHESEEKYRFLVENAKDVIWKIDLQGKWTFVSSNVKQLTGYSSGEIVGKTVWDFMAPECHDYFREKLRKRMHGEEIPPYEGKIISKDGHYIPFEVHAAPILDSNGKVVGIQGVSRDISNRKRAEKALRESEEMFRAVAETASAAICILQDRKFQYVNPAMEEISGYSKEELLSLDFMELVHHDVSEHILGQYGKWLMGTSAEARSALKGIDRNGKVRWADVSRKTISYHGRPAVLLTGIDITELKHAEEALRQSEEKFRVLAETSPAAICVFRGDEYVYVNPAVERISGYSKEEFLKMKLWDPLVPEFRYRLKERMEARNRGAPVPSHYELSFVSKSGEVKWVDISLGPVNIGGAPAFIVSAFDVTERKLAEKELMEAKAQAELYLDLLGHDINNMHQMALGYLEIARDAWADENQKLFLDKPIEVLQRSAQLIRNVRKLQKAHEGAFNAQTINLCTLLSDLGREYGALPGKSVSVNLNGHTHCYVRANELLYDVFSNLVSNAIRHTPEHANIYINLDSGKDGDTPCYMVSVEDDGQGIPDDFKGIIFSRSFKGTSRKNGMGIGLYLVKTLVDSYRGGVWVEDRVPGNYAKGAKFVVRLPSTTR